MRPPAGGGEPSELAANLTTFRDGRAIEIVHYPDPEDARVVNVCRTMTVYVLPMLPT